MISTTAHLSDGREVIVSGNLLPPEYDVGLMGYGVEDVEVRDAQTDEAIEVDDEEEYRLIDILISDWKKERW